MKGIIPNLKRASPTILTILGAVGVVATAVTAAKATPKAMKLCEGLMLERVNNYEKEPTKLEYAKECWHCYIPSALIGAATITCIFGANALNKRQQAAITSAYILLNRTYKEYRDKVRETYGEEAEEQIHEAVHESHIEKDTDDKLLFYDEFSGEYFERTMLEVLDAEYQFNRTFVLEGEVKLNDFYEYLNLPKTDLGEVVRWDVDSGIMFYGYQWIEFEHNLVTIDDGAEEGLECYIIHIPYIPSLG